MNGVTIASTNPTLEQEKIAKDSKLCDLKVKNYLFKSIDKTMENDLGTRYNQRYMGLNAHKVSRFYKGEMCSVVGFVLGV